MHRRVNRDSPAVLIVESDEAVLEAVSSVLAENGCRVVQACSAAAARMRLGDLSPDVILLDYNLPDASGESVVREMVQTAPGAGLIVMTGFADASDAVQSLKLGARVFLFKDPSFLTNVPLVVRRIIGELETERKLRATERKLRQRIRRQAAVADFELRALSFTKSQELFDEVTSLIVKVAGVELAIVQELLPGGERLRLRSGAGRRASRFRKNLVDGHPETPIWLALRSRTPVIVEDLFDDSRFAPTDELDENGIVSGVTVLIPGLVGPYGALGMYSTSSRKFGNMDVDFLQALANVLAAALRRVDLEESLRQEETFCAAMSETMGAVMLVLDRNGRVISFNHACQELTGYTLGEVAGKPVWDFLVPHGERKAARRLKHELKSGKDHSRFESLVLTKTGEERLISWSNSVVRKDSGPVEAIIATGIDITEQRKLERELLEAAENERQRLGQDLHDDLCQYLGGIGMMMNALGHSLGKMGLTDEESQVGVIAGHLKEALERTRLLAHGLAPLQTGRGEMAVPFKELALYVEKVAKVHCRCAIAEDAEPADASTATQLFRITQEAVQNAIRHGHARDIEISGQRQQDGVLLYRISDDGCGFSSESQGGSGFRNMKQRAHLIGARLAISSTPGSGTVVSCLVPVAA